MPKARYTRDRERGGYRYNFRQANGKYTTLRAATVPEMDALIRQKTKERDEGLIRKEKLTVRDVAELWLPTAIEGKSASSENSTRTALRHVLEAIGDRPVREVLPAEIDRMLMEAPGQSVSSRGNMLSVTRRIFNYAVDNEYADRNPAQHKKAGGRKPPEVMPLTKAQQEELLNKASGTRLYLFVLLCLRTGMRHGEALGLTWQDVDFRRKTVTVSGIVHRERDMKLDYAPVTKTTAGRRTIPMPSDLEEALREAKRESKSKFVIADKDGNHMNQEKIYCRWKALNLTFPCHPHQLRHTYVTELCAKSAEVGLDIKTIQYLAGHATPSITLKIYSHVRESQSAETTRKIREIFG